MSSILWQTAAPEHIASVQSINKNSYELLYICSITNALFDRIVTSYKASNRLLDGVKIYELKKGGKTQLAWANLDGYLVLSKSSLLVENAIRIHHSSPARNFKTQNPLLFGFVTIKADAGNVWVNYGQLSQSSVPLFKTLHDIPLFSSLAVASVLDVTRNNDHASLSGFTLDSPDKTWGLHRFQNQNPVKIDVMRFVPNATKVFVHYGMSNVDAFISGDPDEPRKSDLQDEIGVCVLDGAMPVVFLKVKDGFAYDQFEYIESYADYDIRKVADSKITDPVKPLLPEGDYTLLTFKDGYVFLSANADELKLLIDAIEADETWGRSVDFQQFFNTCLQEGNVSVFYSGSALLGHDADVTWKQALDSLRITSTTWGSMQFNSLDNHFYTSSNFYFPSRKQPEKRKVERRTYELSNNLEAGFVVRNYTNGLNELLVQDSTFKVYLFSQAAGVQWMYAMNEKIEQVQQLDYFKNGKLQYLVTTASDIYLIDRLGRDVEGFPKRKNLNYRFSEVVDYDKSRNYRIMVTSGASDIYILDKSMQELEGWSPKKMNARILFSPKHYRIGGKDYFMVITENGQLHLFNRRGEYEKGYPVSINKNISGDYFLDQGNSLANSAVYFISADGIVNKVVLDGKSTNESLIRGSKSKFYLATAAGKPDCYFFRMDTDKVAVFDRKNQLVFERQNPGSQNLKSDVVKSPDGVPYFCFYDEEQNLSYIFDSTGNSVVNRPVETTLPPLFNVNQKTKQVSVFAVYQNSISSVPLN
ncbi:MAG: hypothetical protein KIT62_15595 [Cyclobacteriaceae bacterium]|nr:hypothetical protein [Cyclobacteriaceae bacterium]